MSQDVRTGKPCTVIQNVWSFEQLLNILRWARRLIDDSMELVMSGPSIATALVVVAGIALSSCTEAPEYLRLPRQYAPTAQDDFIPDAPMLVMGPTVIPEDDTTNGILSNDSDWPWSNEHPRFRCFVRDGGPWQFAMQFAVAGVTLKDTGPITISVSINDALFSKFVVSSDGRAEYVRDVPTGLLARGAVHVGLTIQPFWTSPTDGQRLGILIHSIGFRRRPA